MSSRESHSEHNLAHLCQPLICLRGGFLYQKSQFLYVSIKEGAEVLDIKNNNTEEVKNIGGFSQTMTIVQIIGVRVTMAAIKNSGMVVEMAVDIMKISEAYLLLGFTCPKDVKNIAN